MDSFVRGWRQRAREAREANDAEVASLLETAARCARLLVETFGARRVWVFGSVARGDRLDAHSDLDLAVEGLSEASYWRALATVAREAPRPVQLVPLESAAPSLVEVVRSEGRLLLES